MGIAIILICFLLTIFDYSLNKKIYSPSIIFNSIFIVLIILTVINPSNLSEIKMGTYLIILLGIISFNLGQILSKKFIKQINHEKKNRRNKNMIKNERYILLIIFSLIFSYFMIKNSITIILDGGGITEIYQERIASVYVEDSMMEYSSLESSIINYISNPLVTLSIVSSIIMFFKTSNMKYLIISFIFLLIQSFSTGGRTNIIYYIIYIVIGLFSVKDVKQLIKKYSKHIVGLVFVLILLVGYFISERQTDIAKTFVSYLGLPLYHMEYKLSRLGEFNYTLGFTSLMSLFNLLNFPLRAIGFEEWSILTNAKNLIYYADETAYLGNNIQYNAFVTCFYHFYVDGGYLGVIILSLCFGVFCGWCFYRYININDDFVKIIFYLSIACPVVFSFVRFQYCNATIPFAMIYSYIFLFRKKRLVIKLK